MMVWSRPVGDDLLAEDQPNLIEQMEFMARKHPDQVMLQGEQGQLTWADFRQAVRAVASWMRREGQMRAGDRVGLYRTDGFAYLILLHGCWMARLIPVNLGLALDNQTLSVRLQESGCRMLVIGQAHLVACQTALLRSPVRKVVVTRPDDTAPLWSWLAHRLDPRIWWRLLRQEDTLFEPYALRDILEEQGSRRFDPLDPEQIALIHYTNGLSSEPRAVSYNFGVLMSAVARASALYSEWLLPNRLHVCWVPLSLSLGLGYGLLVLYRGGRLCLSSVAGLRRHPARMLEQAVSMAGHPAVYRHLQEAQLPPELLQQARLFFCGGAHVPLALQQQWHQLTGHYIHATYGLSEAGFLVAAHTPMDVNPHTDGRILPGIHHRLCHPAQQVDTGTDTGELWLQSQLMMSAYWQNRGAMESRMTRDGWLRTGDLVRIQNHQVTVICRCSDLLWRHEQMILPQTLEQVAGQHAQVRASAAIQDTQGVHRPIVLLVEAEPSLDLDGLTLLLMDRLEDGELPDQVVRVDRLPRSVQGEVSRRMARECFLSPEADPDCARGGVAS